MLFRSRRLLAPEATHALRIIGVMNADDLPGVDERSLIDRRRSQILALDALQAFTEAEIDARRDPKGG